MGVPSDIYKKEFSNKKQKYIVPHRIKTKRRETAIGTLLVNFRKNLWLLSSRINLFF
jgi:hypothetical protein